MCDAAWGGVSVRGVRMPRCLDTTPVSAAMYFAHCGVKGSSRAGAVGASLVTRISFRETTHRTGIGKQNYELYNTFTFIYIPYYIYLLSLKKNYFFLAYFYHNLLWHWWRIVKSSSVSALYLHAISAILLYLLRVS